MFISKQIKFLRKYNLIRNVSYIQGQEPEPKIREYFYYIDHQGMLFLDDARIKNFTSCFKDKQFLAFFFKRVRPNNTDRYRDSFPFLSLCGRERNFIRCDDLPIVFTHILNSKDLTFGYAGDALTQKFEPDKIYMSLKNGRVYHPASELYGGIGLIRSKLAIELSKDFEFDKGETPTHFNWQGERIKLDTSWLNNVKYKSFNE